MDSFLPNSQVSTKSGQLQIGAFGGVSSGHPSEPADAPAFTLDFNRGPQGFVGGFADYPPAAAAIYELTSDYRALPPPLESQSGLFLSGVNRSDDLFMFLKGPLSGLLPGALYTATVSLEIATNTPAGCLGVGGSPGESVWIKAGVTAVEPLPVRDGSYLRMNIDIGNQSGSGAQAVVLGNIANSRNCEQSRQWELKSFQGRSMPTPISVPADGRVWLLFGTDSGFEARTEIYFTRVSVTFTPMADGWRMSCAEHYVTARAIRTREEMPAFVRCAAEYALEHGAAEARRAFNEDLRWKHGQIHVFVHGVGPLGEGSLTHVFPPDPSREGTVWEMPIDGFGTDYFFELHRLLLLVDEGWIYYTFTNPATGLRQPKSSYVMEIDWNGERAAIGAGIHRRDLPGTCRREEVNATQLEEHPSSQRLQEFVRCAAMELETTGYFGLVSLSTGPRWRSHSIYLFGVDMYGNTLFTGTPYNWRMGISPSELSTIAAREDVAVAEAFGETFLYYTSVNPSNGMPQRKASFVKRVAAFGVPILIGAGYYLDE